MQARGTGSAELAHPTLGTFFLHYDAPDRLAFCDNETNHRRLHGAERAQGFFKDGLHALVVDGDESAVNPAKTGTKVLAAYRDFHATTRANGWQMDVAQGGVRGANEVVVTAFPGTSMAIPE